MRLRTLLAVSADKHESLFFELRVREARQTLTPAVRQPVQLSQIAAYISTQKAARKSIEWKFILQHAF